MKFVVELAGKCGGRAGCFAHPENGSKFQTPLLLQTTKGGSIPYLSREVFKYVTEAQHILQMCFSSTDHMEEALKLCGKGISNYVGYGDFLSFLCFKDPCETVPSGFNEKDVVPLFTRRGKQNVTAEKFMDLIETFKPDIYHSLCDSDTNEDSSKKRTFKSVDRTEKFFKICLDRHKGSDTLKKSMLFAPIVGGYNLISRSQSVRSVFSVPEVGGFLIDGFHNNGETASKLNIESVKEVITHCIKNLPTDKPKMMLGAYSPLMILELIKLGIDIFDTSYIYVAVTKNLALTFTSNLKDDKSMNGKFCINLKDDRNKEDFGPLLDGCICLACRKHTKAYVNHLLKTNELLGPILLMIHNTHHYLQFFENIRETIKNDQLPDLIALIEKQMTENSAEDKDLLLSSSSQDKLMNDSSGIGKANVIENDLV